MKLSEAKSEQNVTESNLNKIKKEVLNQKHKKLQLEKLKCYKMHETKLSSYFMIILQLHLRLIWNN